MRAIDVDAFKADYRMADECKDCKTPVRACEYDRVYTKMDFCSWLDDAPTIELEPEQKTGRWIKISSANIYECSECGKNVRTDDICEYQFCHGCGVKMEGEG